MLFLYYKDKYGTIGCLLRHSFKNCMSGLRQKVVWQEKEQLFKVTCRYVMTARGLGRGYKTADLGRDINTFGGQSVTYVMPVQVVHKIITLLFLQL
jgi:hypothetical protein